MHASWSTTRPVTTLQHADIGIVGGGVAAVAAALALGRGGRRVVMIDRQAAAAWECGWTFALPAGEAADPAWIALGQAWQAAGAMEGGRIAGAQAEVESEGLLADAGVVHLGYQAVVGILRAAAGAMAGVMVAGRCGLSRVVAGRWIDASEEGELVRIADPSLRVADPAGGRIAIAWQHPAWPCGRLDLGRLPGAGDLRLEPGRWANERLLLLDVPAGDGHRRFWLPALQRLHAVLGTALGAGICSHGSLLPLPLRAGVPASGLRMHAGCAIAAPAICGLAEDTAAARAALGGAAARLVLDLPAAGAPAGEPWYAEVQPRSAEVVVAGLGTGGSLAALAAARAGARVLGCEPLPCLGGTGTAGGIHGYYFGVRGGLQDEVDAQVMEVRRLFHDPDIGFHPEAKKVVLDGLLRGAGVDLRFGTVLAGVRREGGRIVGALAIGADGPLAISAPCWIDGTGDGDLAAMAGAGFRLGRASDRLGHAYTQSSGRCAAVDGRARMQYVNYDSGYCDPTDPLDLVRARIAGVLQYRRRRDDGWDRPTYIAPLIGLREGRLVDTDAVLELRDLIEGTAFPDAIGLHGGHIDAHAVDVHHETDELLFWFWGCRQWGRARTACQLPYRCLLPSGVDNLWLASRCLGVSHDAHYGLRMERDMQRIGEVAGIAAALAARGDGRSRSVPAAAIRGRLAPGALEARDDDQRHPFGWQQPARFFGRDRSPPGDDAACARLAGQLADEEGAFDIRDADAGAGGTEVGIAMWRLYRAGAAAVPHLLPLLAGEARTSWRAAVVLAALGRREAEPRLLRALREREDGFAGEPPARGPDIPRWHLARSWIAAIALLRTCGGLASLPELAALVDDPALPFDAAVAMAGTLGRIAGRHPEAPVAAILDALLSRFPGPVPLPPHRPVNLPPAAALAGGRADTAEDASWHLHLAVAVARRRVGLPPHAAALALRGDPRAHVRRALAAALDPSYAGIP